MIEAVIFDLDGTLLDTLGDLCASCNYVLEKYNHKTVTLEETKSYVGNGIKNLVLKCLNYDDEDLDRCFNTFKEYYKDHCDIYTKPYDGIYDVLDYLKGKGIKLGCFSNKAQYALDILVKNHFDGYFDIVLGDGAGFKRKPDKEGLVHIAKELSCNINNILYVGDSDVDQKLIENSNCKGAIVSYGFRDERSLKNAGINVLYNDTKSLLNYIKSVI